MPNQFAEAFAQLNAVRDNVLGAAETATFGATSGVPVVMGILTRDMVFMPGARRENGGFDLQVAVSALGAEPAEMSKVTFDGRVLSVQSVQKVNGAVYFVTCGDPSQ